MIANVWLRTLGSWLFYATVGGLLVVMLVAGAGDLGPEGSSPTRRATKIVSALSGVAIFATALGAYLLFAPGVLPLVPRVMVAVGAPLAIALSIWSWAWIARDLRRHADARRR